MWRAESHQASPAVFACQALETDGLTLPGWCLPAGSLSALLGGNGAGKTRVARLLTGALLPAGDPRILRQPASTVWVSQETQQAFYEDQLRQDEFDLTDVPDAGTPVRALLQSVTRDERAIDRVLDALGLAALQQRGYRLLSSGEARRAMLARALLQTPELLILEAPFEGIDAGSINTLKNALPQLVPGGTTLLMLVGHRNDLPAWLTHLGLMAQGHLLCFGPAQTVQTESAWRDITDISTAPIPQLPAARAAYQLPGGPANRPLITLRAGQVNYGDITQFGPVDWTLRPGEHTQIIGPNGCGKSTLLHLVTGDHPQCYTNDLTIFGYRRGSGESIWDIKKHIGIVSSDLHRNYRVHDNALTTVATGLTDSIGLYRPVGDEETRLAREWLALIGLSDRANALFRTLSAGEQRLVLIARALIKQPPLLILDEPTQSLDDRNRFRVLAVVERLVHAGQTTLLLVSHRQDESLPLIRRRLVFKPTQDSHRRYRVEATTS